MKHALAFMAILALAGCASAPKPADPAPTLPDTHAHLFPTVQRSYSGDGWSLTAPGSFAPEPVKNHIVLVLKDGTAFRIAALDIEPFNGPVGEFVFLAYHAMKDAGYSVSALKRIKWAGTDAAYMEVAKGGMKMFSWSLVANNTAYSWGCGGLETDQDATGSVCREMADSFTLTKK